MRSRPPRRTPSRRASRAPLPSWLRRSLLLARLLLVACVVQLSGGAHVLVSAVQGTDAACIDTCDCPDDGDGDDHDCPPGCPDCSCPHGRLPSLPPALVPELPERLVRELPVLSSTYRASTPPSPSLPSLERPPRA